ncbi:penicillin-insensitive murein endopeptidase [Shewanella sp. KX20019]|uniref:penicillin-insensitive murein endopeptidase n=1 Tax=Shewanella sp. KX20019 TaxID=2803864 RepID=UPI00192895B1|nr:penicillin-insensitive murein endopeptidase [Shewanella sp. KX20019]QQX80725.1 penicillin-insensitive murein endopeptidase [Shewanella sp. KX20019]
MSAKVREWLGSASLGRLSRVLSLMLIFTCTGLPANQWEQLDTPYGGSIAAMGSYANGCLAGAEALPLSGEGFQVIRTERQRYYGHPLLISFITQFASDFQQYNHGDLLIADMSMPRGGNFSHGHSSHQIGLDVDIWLKLTEQVLTPEQREQPLPFDIVDDKKFTLDSKQWRPQHTQMLKLAAEDHRVARIFVSPVIKQHLCNMEFANDNWLSKVRPWWGHTYHMHVRLHCPAGDTSCISQAVIPDGNGCNELSWWKQQMTQTKPKSPAKKTAEIAKKKNKKLKPKQCSQLLYDSTAK